MLRVHMFNYTNCKQLVSKELFYFFVPAGVLDLPFSVPPFLYTMKLCLVLFQLERVIPVCIGIANHVILRKTEKRGRGTERTNPQHNYNYSPLSQYCLLYMRDEKRMLSPRIYK